MLEGIRKLCKRKGISMKQLEADIGLATNTIYRWDKNAPSIDKVISVADYFLVPMDEVLERNIGDISDNKRELLSVFDELNEEGQETALNVIRSLALSGQYKKHNQDRLAKEEA